MGIGIVVCSGFHLLWKELPHIDILEEGTDPCPKFQGLARFSPCAGIIPYLGVDCPKMGLPPAGKEAEEKVLLPNVPFQENGVEPTDILCEGGP
jgi:hypothetical protein